MEVEGSAIVCGTQALHCAMLLRPRSRWLEVKIFWSIFQNILTHFTLWGILAVIVIHVFISLWLSQCNFYSIGCRDQHELFVCRQLEGIYTVNHHYWPGIFIDCRQLYWSIIKRTTEDYKHWLIGPITTAFSVSTKVKPTKRIVYLVCRFIQIQTDMNSLMFWTRILRASLTVLLVHLHAMSQKIRSQKYLRYALNFFCNFV